MTNSLKITAKEDGPFTEMRLVFYPSMFSQAANARAVAEQVAKDAQEKIAKAIIEYAKKRGIA